MVGRPTLVTGLVQSHVIEVLYRNPKMPSRELHDDLWKYLKEKLKQDQPKLTDKEVEEALENGCEGLFSGYQVPGESAITKWLKDNKIRETIIERLKRPEELDREWSIGSCLKYNIPPAMAPILIEIQQVEKEPSKLLPAGIELTIRECRWIAFLYQGVNASEVLKNKWEPKQLKGQVSIMASIYAKREQIAEIMQQPIDTSDLDEFFSNPDTDFVKLWLKTFNPEQYEKDKQAFENFIPAPINLLSPIFGTITQAEVDMFNEWLKNQYFSQIEPHKSGEIEKQLLSRNPELKILIDKYNTANDKFIEGNKKDGDKND